MEKIKNLSIPKKIIAICLSVAILASVVVAIGYTQLNPTIAAEVPGTEAYYKARWEDAKVRAKNLPVGTSYKNYQNVVVTTKTEGPWKLDLDWGNTCCEPRESSGPTPPSAGSGTQADPYIINNVNELLFYFYNLSSSHCKLGKDLDMGGYNDESINNSSGSITGVFDGAGHTIYNINVPNTGSYTSFFGALNGAVIKNLRISNSQALSSYSFSGFFSSRNEYLGNENKNFTIENCVIENSLQMSYTETSMFTGCNAHDFTIKNCYARNVHVYTTRFGYKWSCVAVFMAIPAGTVLAENSFVTDSSVISSSGHSGGFTTCGQLDGNFTYNNCFANLDMYGNKAAGVFCGGQENGTHTYNNCFSTGKVEGVDQLGGFSSDNEPYFVDHTVTTTYNNCYSTAMVGMDSNATCMGGFFGNARSTIDNRTGNSIVSFNNCYAAGEVGSIATDSSENRTKDFTVGGFIGNVENPMETEGNVSVLMNNCYYDKQTTAMREWGSGITQYFYELHGLLTTDTSKSGAGLTNTRISSAYNLDLGTGYYPQLTVFSNPTTFTNTNWMTQSELNNCIKANSKASVSTVMLDTYVWDCGGLYLPDTTYDTVRDVTSAFKFSSSAAVGPISWERCGVDGSATLNNGTGASSQAFGIRRPVFRLNNYSGSDVLPGVDWARATVDVGGQTASRALRICPRIGLYAGLSYTVGVGEYYDHANDVRLVYTTGARLTDSDPTNDYTYGVYPDDPLESYQTSLLNNSAYKNTADLIAKYKTYDNKFTNVSVSEMERTGTSLTSGIGSVTSGRGVIDHVYVREILAENSDGSFVYGNSVDLTDTTQANKWNGKTVLNNGTDGDHIYQLEYIWSLSDGRYVKGYKRVDTTTQTHNLTISVQNLQGKHLSTKAYLDAYDISNGQSFALSDTTMYNDVLMNQIHGNPAAVAWKLTDASEPIYEIRVTFKSSDGSISRTTTIPASSLLPTNYVGATTGLGLYVPRRVYTYDGNGNLKWVEDECLKTYSSGYKIHENKVCSISFDDVNSYNFEDGVCFNDLDMDIDVVLVIDAEPDSTANTSFNFHNTRTDEPWASGKMDVINDMPAIS